MGYCKMVLVEGPEGFGQVFNFFSGLRNAG